MNTDEYFEVINGEETYKEIASELKLNANVMIGWTDEHGSHLDILFSLNVKKEGNWQGGLSQNDLFVSIMRVGAFGFRVGEIDTHYSYYGEKLYLGAVSLTTKKIAELINGVKKELINEKK